MISDINLMVQIKGIKDGLLITLEEGRWPDLHEGLLCHIDERAGFFEGAKVSLDVGHQVIHAAEMGVLRDKLSDRGVSLWAVISTSVITEKTAQMLGLATRLSSSKVENIIKKTSADQPGESAIFICRTLRSGFRVSYQGHIVIIGDVNPGAEIVASGSIVIWGRLRGMVHAGAEGDERAVVCALDLMPTQLRIAGYISITPKREGKLQPELAHVINGQVVAEEWK